MPNERKDFQFHSSVLGSSDRNCPMEDSFITARTYDMRLGSADQDYELEMPEGLLGSY